MNTPSTPNDDDGLVGLTIAGRLQLHHHPEDLTPVMRNVSYADGGVGSGGGGIEGVDGGIGGVGVGGNRGLLQQRRLPLLRSSTGTTSNNNSSASKSRSSGLRSTGFFPATSPSSRSSSARGATTTAIGGGSGGMVGGVSMPPPPPKDDERMSNKSPSPTKEDSTSSPPSDLVILPGIYSDDDDSSTFMDLSSSNRSNKRGGGAVLLATEDEDDDGEGGMSVGLFRHVKKTKDGSSGMFLAPIELKPDRKFFSFQGSLQYKSQVVHNQVSGSGGAVEGRPAPTPLLATIHSPPRRPLLGETTTATRENNDHYSSPKVVTAATRSSSPKQYEPRGRSQHGVTEMADTKELDAIFKSPPRNTRSSADDDGGVTTTTTTSFLYPTVVTPAREQDEEEEEPSTMITNLPPNQDPEFLQPFPLDDRDYSIPSIRLANAVHRSDSLASYEGMYSRTFSDEDESTWEGSFYLDEEDEDLDTEASWSTSGGGGSLRMRRQIMRHLSSNSLQMRHLNSGSSEGGQQLLQQQQEERMLSGSLHELRHLNSSEGQTNSSSVPAIAPSNSFMERMQGITINPRSNTFDSSSDVESYQGGGGPPVVLNVESSNPALIINATQSMDDAEYETRQDRRVRRSNHHSHRSARRRRSSHGRTSSAVEWIQGLQNPSNGGGVQIVEAASSKFLTGGADGAGPEKAAAASEDVSKALGMPHPLCRSSTIEAGPFVNRVVAATTAANGLNGIGE